MDNSKKQDLLNSIATSIYSTSIINLPLAEGKDNELKNAGILATLARRAAKSAKVLVDALSEDYIQYK